MDNNKWKLPSDEDSGPKDRVKSTISEKEELNRAKSNTPETSKKENPADKSIDAHRDTINNTGDDPNSKQTDADAATG